MQTQKSLALAEAEGSQEMLAASVKAQRDQKLMALEQSFMQQKMALEQERAQAMAKLEQQAFAVSAQAQQARLAAEMQSKYMGLPVPASAPEESTVSEQKERSAGQITARAEAAQERLAAQYNMQKELVTLEAQRTIDVATASIAAQQKQSAMALDQRLQQQSMALNQRKLEAEGQLRQTTLALTAQAESARLQREAAEQVAKGVPAMGFFGNAPVFGYPAYTQAPVFKQ